MKLRKLILFHTGKWNCCNLLRASLKTDKLLLKNHVIKTISFQ